MKITKQIQDTVLDALRKQNVSKKEFAAMVGMNPAWVSKFFNGKLKTLTDGIPKRIESGLGIKLLRILPKGEEVPGVAVDLGELMTDYPELSVIANSLVALTQAKTRYAVPFMTPKELIKIGGEITRIVHQWENGEDPHYAKIGLESVKVIAAVMRTKEKSQEP